MKRFAVVGSPIEHSLSPVLHQAAFATVGLDWSYGRFEIREGELFKVLQEQRFDGLSVTMPLKAEAFAISRTHDEFANATNAVNTLLRGDDEYLGFNTDVPGMRSALEEAGIASIDRAVVIGSGATARSAVVALRPMARQLILLARNSAAAQGIAVDVMDDWNQPKFLASADLVVSTIPEGSDHLSSGSGLLFDLRYRPWPTPLAARWDGPVISGLELLIHQAALQTQIFLERSLDLVLVRRAMRAAIADSSANGDALPR